MTDILPSSHAETGRPLANSAYATAALAACLGVRSSELALIAEGTADRFAQIPAHATVGYAADAMTGEIFLPGATLPKDRRLYASVRIALPDSSEGPDAVLETLAALAANGWRLQRLPKLAPALDRSLEVVRARPEDLKSIPLPAGTTASAASVDGRGVLLGVVDFGCDFAHPAFLKEDGHTRLLFLWDQNASDSGPVPGTFRERVEIDKALVCPDPYAALGYWPDRNCYAPAASRGNQIVHGTHVLGVAAGREVVSNGPAGNCPAGVAPGADLAFVHLRPGALVSCGDPADVFDGVCAIFARAAALGMPAVVNLSLGANSGSHDGDTLYDCALDALLAWPGRAIAVAAGNERQAKLNLEGLVKASEPVCLGWKFDQGDGTQNTLRIFSEAPGALPQLDCSVRLAGVELTRDMTEGQNAQQLVSNGQVRGMLYSGLATTRGPIPLQQIEIRVQPSGSVERFDVTLSTESGTQVAFDARIDRDDRELASQSHFDLEQPVTKSSLASTACGRRTLCVGAFGHRVPNLPPAFFSAEGLTRDGRAKPDVSAPGLDVAAAAAYGGRVPPGGTWLSLFKVKMNGSSAAAPHVAGVQALMLQLSPRLHADDSSTILRETARLDAADNAAGAAGWHVQLGCGRIDAAAALARVGR